MSEALIREIYKKMALDEAIEKARGLVTSLKEKRMELAKLAYNTCKEHNITHTEFAKRIGVSNNTVGRWIQVYQFGAIPDPDFNERDGLDSVSWDKAISNVRDDEYLKKHNIPKEKVHTVRRIFKAKDKVAESQNPFITALETLSSVRKKIKSPQLKTKLTRAAKKELIIRCKEMIRLVEKIETE